jgi:hypothetical protein
MNVSPAKLAMAVVVFGSCHFGSLLAQQIGGGNASDPTAPMSST